MSPLAVIAAALGVAAALIVSSDAAAQQPVPKLTLKPMSEAAAGDEIKLAAFLSDVAGSPIAGEEISFSLEATFLNVDDEIELGATATDGAGVATLVFRPRGEGEIVVAASFAGNEKFAGIRVTAPMTVASGGQLYREFAPFRIPGANFWMVIAILAVVWLVFAVSMGLIVWGNYRGRTELGEEGAGQTSHWRTTGSLVPMAGVAVLAAVAGVLILQVTLRPWASADYSFDTHLNIAQPPDDYTRTGLTFLGEVSDGPSGWTPSEIAQGPDSTGFPTFVGYGCAACHGLDGAGGVVGKSLAEVTESRLRKQLRNGPEGMPSYVHLSASDELLAGLYKFVARGPAAVTESPTAVRTLPSPTASSEPMPTAAPAPASVPEATPEPATVATPQTAPPASPVAIATPVATSESLATPATQPTAEKPQAQKVTLNMFEFGFEPSTIELQAGVPVELTVVNKGEEGHGLWLPDFGIKQNIKAFDSATLAIVPRMTGSFRFDCSDKLCGTKEEHGGMTGLLIIVK